MYDLGATCKGEEETCGWELTDIEQPFNHGDCCDGFDCDYSVNMTISPGTCKKGMLLFLMYSTHLLNHLNDNIVLTQYSFIFRLY